MQTVQAIITGIIQGLSEFLPISSSAHICFSNELYNLITHSAQNAINEQEEIFFDIMVHLGTLVAVLIYFFNDIKTIFKDFFQSIKIKNYKNENVKLVAFILLSTIITGIIGIIIEKPAQMLVQNPKYICFFLFMTGIILLLSEKFYSGNKNLDLKKAIVIAISQGLAVFPGLSRSGLTISSGLFLGMDRKKAARFSFLMSIPVILLASMIYPLFKLDYSEILTFNLKAIFIGTFVSFVTGYFCIKYFMQLLGKLSLRIFGYYCLFVSFCLFLLFQVVYHQ